MKQDVWLVSQSRECSAHTFQGDFWVALSAPPQSDIENSRGGPVAWHLPGGLSPAPPLGKRKGVFRDVKEQGRGTPPLSMQGGLPAVVGERPHWRACLSGSLLSAEWGGSCSLCYLKTSLPEVGHLMQPPPLGAPLGAPSPTPAVQKGSRGQCALECSCPTALCPSSFQNMGRGRWAGGGWCSASKEGMFGAAKWRDGRLPPDSGMKVVLG